MQAINYGDAILFNLGYGGASDTAGTTVAGGKIILASEQAWTSTATTQDSYMQFQTALNGTLTDQVRITSAGNVGIGTTNPTSLLELGTNEGDMTFSGTGNHDITASAGTLRLGAVTATGAITAASSPLNIGSSGVRFGTIYADSVDATNLVGGVVTGSTTSADWTINSDNATADTEDMTVTFERGTASPNAVLKWTSASDQFDFNFGGSFSGNVGIGTTAPTHPLHIYRAGSTTLEVDSDATWDTWTYYSQADVLKAAVGYRNSNAGLTFYESDADRMDRKSTR